MCQWSAVRWQEQRRSGSTSFLIPCVIPLRRSRVGEGVSTERHEGMAHTGRCLRVSACAQGTVGDAYLQQGQRQGYALSTPDPNGMKRDRRTQRSRGPKQRPLRSPCSVTVKWWSRLKNLPSVFGIPSDSCVMTSHYEPSYAQGGHHRHYDNVHIYDPHNEGS